MARATDVAGRTQPLETPFNDGGYFFDAVVRHPVTVVVTHGRARWHGRLTVRSTSG